MTKCLKTLQKEWYKKIEAQGFTDIEYPTGQVKKFQASIHKIEHTQKYFSIAQDFLNNFTFNSELDKQIWALHCEGWSYRQTAKILNIGTNKTQYRMTKLKTIMEIWRKL
jgi:hypothetical protein